jgi:hypothetical protein
MASNRNPGAGGAGASEEVVHPARANAPKLTAVPSNCPTKIGRCQNCGRPIPVNKKARRRPPQYCKPRCRDEARRGRNFVVSGHTRVRVPRNAEKTSANSVTCGGENQDRGSVIVNPLDLVGGTSFRWSGARLDPATIREILRVEIGPAPKTAKAGDPGRT